MARSAQIDRRTKETEISLSLDLDGGAVEVSTGIGFFDHMLTAFAFYARFGLKVTARYASAYIPMDEALCLTALDFSNRAYLVFDAPMPQGMIGAYDACLTEEFMRALVTNAGLTLHQKCLYGRNAHHITEALFKSLGVAMADAVALTGGGVPSTKGVL